MDFLLSGVAASGACLFSNPLEVVKTRMQLQGELRAPGTYRPHYRNAFQAVGAIVRAEGPALQRRGVLGALLGSPVYLVKTHLQVQSATEIAVGHQHSHRGMVHAFISIYREHGILGLWRGASASVPRVMVGSAAQLSSFSLSKDMVANLQVFSPNSWLVALCAAMLSSVAAVVAMTPFDVVSTRLYNQPVDPQGKGLMYRGFLNCFALTIQKEGILGVYKGIGASYFRLGPHTILSLLFWDELRKYYHR